MKRTLQILNIASIVFALVMNFIVGAQLIDVPSIKSVSDQYATLLTPATYAFSVWSLIYTLLIILAVYQARDLFKPKEQNDIPDKLGLFFIIANIGNALWTYIFVSGYIFLSVIVLLVMVASLFVALKRLNVAMAQPHVRTLACVWWPLMLYTGWVLVASVVNTASWLRSFEITINPLVAVTTLFVLGAILLWLLLTRHVRELLLASIWGIAAVGVRQYTLDESRSVAIAAFGVCSILLAAVVVHGYKNRKESILGQL